LIVINCSVTDEYNDVHSANFYCRIDGGNWFILEMNNTYGDIWEITLGGPFFPDVLIEYYFVVRDSTPYTSNIRYVNNSGLYYSLTIIDGSGPILSDLKHYPRIVTDIDPIKINCSAMDYNGIHNLTLNYQIDDFNYTSVLMHQTNETTWEYFLGYFDCGTKINYFVTAFDDSIYYNKAIISHQFYSNITIYSTDSTAPVISGISYIHTDTTENYYTLTCSATDSNGILNVRICYYLNGDIWPWIDETLDLILGNTYSVTIGPFEVGDEVGYWLIAKDASPNHNRASTNPHSFIVKAEYSAPPTVEHSSLYYIIPVLVIFPLIVIIRKRKKDNGVRTK
ncbi:MAG: hypothetical protein ACTSQK_09770, partial [Candidatus Heimdallarchaeota archaeon]